MLNKYYRFNKIAGINIEIDPAGNPTYNICALSIEGSQLTIVRKDTSVTDINEIKKIIPDQVVTALNITGKGVLIKQIIGNEKQPANIATVLPNLNMADFYTQVFVSGQQTFVAVIRIPEAEKWLAKCKNLGLDIVNLSLGPFAADRIISQLNIYDQEFVFNGHVIHVTEQQNWLAYSYQQDKMAQFPYKLENEKLEEKLIIPYADAFQLYLYPDANVIGADVPSLKKRMYSKVENKKLKVYSTLILFVVFVLLLFNIWLFSHYSSANALLATRVGQTEMNANMARLFADSTTQNKQLLDTLGWDGGIRKSVLIDDIAQMLPAEIKWEQVTVNPVSISDNRQRFTSRQIKINGVSDKIIPINEWLARLNTLTWVKNARLQNYLYNNELNTGQFLVTINY